MLGVCEAFWAVRNTQHFRNETVHAMSDWFALLRVLFLLLTPYLSLLNGSSALNYEGYLWSLCLKNDTTEIGRFSL